MDTHAHPIGFSKIEGYASGQPRGYDAFLTNAEATSNRSAKRRDQKVKKAARKFTKWTVGLALEMLNTSVSEMLSKATQHLSKWHIDSRVRLELSAVIGELGPINALASNMSVREIAGRAFVGELLAIHAQRPESRFCHATFIDDRIRTRDRRTIIDLRPLRRNVRALLREAGVDVWFGIVEFQPYVTHQRGKGRDIAPHVHVVFWYSGELSVTLLEARMRKSKRLVSFTGAPTVCVSERVGEGEIAHMAAYLLKAPERGANAFAPKWLPDSFRQYDCRMRNDQATRMMELLSCFELSQLMMSSGKSGMAIRTAINRDVASALHPHSKFPWSPAEAARSWRRARMQAGKDCYSPIEVRHS